MSRSHPPEKICYPPMYSMVIFEKTTKCCGLKNPSKKVYKIAKKVLTKGLSRGIIAKLSRETGVNPRPRADRLRRIPESGGPWKLNSVWQERNTQIPVNSYSREKNPVMRDHHHKRANARQWVTNSKRWYIQLWLCRYHLFESLILAQDERWRRA